MLVVTNYPQVPIATTNPATDAARVESQQRPPIVPTPGLVKSHEERPFTPQHERAADQPDIQAKINERLQGKQQNSGQQQEGRQQKDNDKPAPQANNLRDVLRGKPALNRRDVRVSQQPNPTKESLISGDKAAALSNQPDEFYQAVSQHISLYYQEQTLPLPSPILSSFV